MHTRWSMMFIGLLLATGSAVACDTGASDPITLHETVAPETVSESVATAPAVTVYKTPTCGCCKKWIRHLGAAGMVVEAVDVDDLSQIKESYGVPIGLSSCHTALVEGFVIEGHVPAADVLRLLEERPPEVMGLAVPGMPIGSPGMEGPNPEHYVVYSFDSAGQTRRFASHGP